MIRFAAVFAIAQMFSLPLAAQEFESTRLFSSGAWSVDITVDLQQDSIWCAAETTNSEGQLFSVVAYPSAHATVFVFDNRWNFDEVDTIVEFFIQIDDTRWTMDGLSSESGVSVDLNSQNNAGDFVSDIAEGWRMHVLRADEHEMASFSLHGSRAALLELTKCWDMILEEDINSQT